LLEEERRRGEWGRVVGGVVGWGSYHVTQCHAMREEE